jgi:hypothetical protein
VVVMTDSGQAETKVREKDGKSQLRKLVDDARGEEQ